MKLVAAWIERVIANVDDEPLLAGIRQEVHDLCVKFPLYPELQKEMA